MAELPIEFRKTINDILMDNPSIVTLGDGQYRVHKLRPYALNRTYGIGLKIMGTDTKEITNGGDLLYAIATDLDACAEVVAIVLCNHLFDAPDISDYKDITDLMNRNDKLVHAMKCKVLLSDSDISQWTNIVIEAFNALNIAEVFQLRTLVKMFSDSATAIRKKTAEQLQSWQQAQSGKWGAS